MKKIVAAILAIVFSFSFIACNKEKQTNEVYTYYNDSFYSSKTSSGESYNTIWYPLSNKLVDGCGFLFNGSILEFSNDSLKDKTELKAYDDPYLSMFIIKYSSFWEQNYLYGQVDYAFPNYNDLDKIEKIIMKDSDDTWIDSISTDKVTEISNFLDISNFMNEVYRIDRSPSNSDYDANNAVSIYEVGLKFENINAIYYLGVIEKHSDEQYFFYNAQTNATNNHAHKIDTNCANKYF